MNTTWLRNRIADLVGKTPNVCDENGAVRHFVPYAVASAAEAMEESTERVLKRAKDLYSALPQEVRYRAENSVPDFLRSRLWKSDRVLFPGNQIADGAWQFGRLSEIPPKEADLAIELIAERAYRVITPLLSTEPALIVCFGEAVHRCGRRLASKLIRTTGVDAHVTMAADYFTPTLWCNPKEIDGKTVVLFVDVTHSGGLLCRLMDLCSEQHPQRILPLTIVDQSCGKLDSEVIYSLWRENREQRTENGDSNRLPDETRFFDPDRSLAIASKHVTREARDIRDAMDRTMEEITDLWPHICGTHALTCNGTINGTNYLWILDIAKLLKVPAAAGLLLDRAASVAETQLKQGRWCIVYPLERRQRAGRWADLLASRFDLDIVPAGVSRVTGFRHLTDSQLEAVRLHDGVLIVDAAIRTGQTLKSLLYVLRESKCVPADRIASLYAMDGLSDADRSSIEDEAGIRVRSAFRFPLSPPTTPLEPYFKGLFRKILSTRVDLPADSVSPLMEYCRRRLEPHGGRQAHTLDCNSIVRQALQDGLRGPEARLERVCRHPRSAVLRKHLDMWVLRDPRRQVALQSFVCNSMQPQVIEWSALALATQLKYEWLDTDWLIQHRHIIASPESRDWEFLTFIVYRLRTDADPATVRRVRNSLQEFSSYCEEDSLPLFRKVCRTDEAGTTLEHHRSQLLLKTLGDM